MCGWALTLLSMCGWESDCPPPKKHCSVARGWLVAARGGPGSLHDKTLKQLVEASRKALSIGGAQNDTARLGKSMAVVMNFEKGASVASMAKLQ